jgi:hypothetical protein
MEDFSNDFTLFELNKEEKGLFQSILHQFQIQRLDVEETTTLLNDDDEQMDVLEYDVFYVLKEYPIHFKIQVCECNNELVFAQVNIDGVVKYTFLNNTSITNKKYTKCGFNFLDDIKATNFHHAFDLNNIHSNTSLFFSNFLLILIVSMSKVLNYKLDGYCYHYYDDMIEEEFQQKVASNAIKIKKKMEEQIMNIGIQNKKVLCI